MILDIIAFLKLLDNYHESTSMYRVLSLACFDIPYGDIVKITHFSNQKTIPIFQVLKMIPKQLELDNSTMAKIDKILALIESCTAHIKTKNVREIILAFMEKSGYIAHINKLPEHRSREILRILNQFDREVQQYVTEAIDPSLKHFLEELAYILDSGDTGALTPDWEEGPETVKVMTIHSAKGLEFRYVFLVNLVDKRFQTVSND